jgi:hypothetical protein
MAMRSRPAYRGPMHQGSNEGLGTEMETSGIEPPTSWLQTRSSSVATSVDKEITSSQASRCTAGCTGERAVDDVRGGDPLAEFVASLSPAQRRRLAELLAQHEYPAPNDGTPSSRDGQRTEPTLSGLTGA